MFIFCRNDSLFPTCYFFLLSFSPPAPVPLRMPFKTPTQSSAYVLTTSKLNKSSGNQKNISISSDHSTHFILHVMNPFSKSPTPAPPPSRPSNTHSCPLVRQKLTTFNNCCTCMLHLVQLMLQNCRFKRIYIFGNAQNYEHTT